MSVSILGASEPISTASAVICEEWPWPVCNPDDPKHKEQELVRDFACMRGTVAMLCGAAGRGKSTLAACIYTAAALGQEIFGLRWTQPCKVLVIQGENEQWDIGRIRNDMLDYFKIRPGSEAWARVMANIVVVKLQGACGPVFVREVRRLLKKYLPDLLVIDPALEYIEGDTNASHGAGQWLRREVRPLLSEFNCLGWIIHHTPKPTKGTVAKWARHSDFTYSGLGSSEFGNAPRITFTLDEVEDGLFALHTNKKISELKWVDAEGRLTGTKWIKWSNDGSVKWQEVDITEVKLKREGKRNEAEVALADVLDNDQPMRLTELLDAMKERGVSVRLARKVVEDHVRDRSMAREMRQSGAKTQPQAWVCWAKIKPKE